MSRIFRCDDSGDRSPTRVEEGAHLDIDHYRGSTLIEDRRGEIVRLYDLEEARFLRDALNDILGEFIAPTEAPA